MDKTLFDDLRQSLEEAKAIAKGEAQPSRRFAIQKPDVKIIREPAATLAGAKSAPGCTQYAGVKFHHKVFGKSKMAIINRRRAG